MKKYIELIKRYRDLIYIALIVVLGIVISSQCSKIDSLGSEVSRKENNEKALAEQIVNYEDELGRINAEKHAYQLTQQELRDSIGLLKKKNHEYLSYINSSMNVKDTIRIETIVEKEIESSSPIENGTIRFSRTDEYGKSSRYVAGEIPYYVNNNSLYTTESTLILNQNIFIEGWLEKDTKTNETFVHLRTDYPDIIFNSGMGIVAESSKSYERSMRKNCGIGLAVGPNFSMSYDFINQKFVPTVGVGVTIGFTYTPKFLQW